MKLKQLFGFLFAKYVVWKNSRWKNNSVKVQDSLLLLLVKKAKDTQFGKDHSKHVWSPSKR